VIRGAYNPPEHRIVVRCFTPTIVQPIADRAGGMANAVYVWHRLEIDGSLYRLSHIEEWLPPHPPNWTITDDTRLPALCADGRMDFEAEAALREQEWQEYERLR
jgi:hypothetical protein